MLPPLVASKRPAGALSPTDVALFPAFPCTAEGCLKEVTHTPGTLPPGGCPGNPLCGLSARSAALYRTKAARRSTPAPLAAASFLDDAGFVRFGRAACFLAALVSVADAAFSVAFFLRLVSPPFAPNLPLRAPPSIASNIYISFINREPQNPRHTENTRRMIVRYYNDA